MNLDQITDLIVKVDLTGPEAALITAAIIATLTAGIIIARKLRHFRLASLGTIPVIAIVLGTTIDGAIRFADTVLDARGVELAFPAIVFESLAFAVYSKAKAHARLYGNGPGRWAGRLYLVGLIAGAIVATGASGIGGAAFRFAIPVFGAWLVILDLTPDRADSEIQETSWRWTPRRIGIKLRILSPRQEDLEQVDRDYQTARIVTTAHRINGASRAAGILKPLRLARLQRLALDADDAMVAEAERRIERASTIAERLNPATISANRQLEAEIIAARSEAEHFRIAADEAATEAATTATTLTGLQAEMTEVRQRLAEAETATHAATGNAERLAAELAAVAAEAEKLADQNRQQADELGKLRAEAATGNRQPMRMIRQPATGNRQRVPATPLMPGNDLPVVEKVAPETVARVVAAWTGNPTATQAEIATLAAVSERTVRTVLKALLRPATNGSAVPQLVSTSPVKE